MATDRTTLRMTDERKYLFDKASEIVARDDTDDPPKSDVIDASLTHLIESHENMGDARGELAPEDIQQFNTSVLKFSYRTELSSRWR